MDDSNVTDTPSTVLDDAPSPSAAGAGQPTTLNDEGSLRDAISSAMKEQEAEIAGGDKTDDKGEEPGSSDEATEKPEQAEKQEKADKADAPEKVEKADEKPAKPVEKPEPRPDQHERRPRHPEPPQNFLPRAKEQWINVPNEVKSEIHRIQQEVEAERRQTREFIEPLVPFHRMAQDHGTTIHEALGRYTQMETALHEQPHEGFRSLLTNLQMQPYQAIGHILKAFNVSPDALARHIAENPQAYVPAATPQPQREDPRVVQLQQQMAQMQQDHIRETVLAPFREANPRYDELEGTIASLLDSGMIPASLSPQERLAAAYDMAVRINPSAQEAHASPTADADLSPRAASDLGGTKSIKSAPGAVSPEMEPVRGGSIRDVLHDEVRRRKVA